MFLTGSKLAAPNKLLLHLMYYIIYFNLVLSGSYLYIGNFYGTLEKFECTGTPVFKLIVNYLFFLKK